MKKTVVVLPRGGRQLALMSAVVVALAGCAPLMQGVAAMSGGGPGDSCDYGGLFRGKHCVDARSSIYLSDETRLPRPRVCGSITVWGAFGSKSWQPGGECVSDLVTFCNSDVLVPGFDNQTIEEHDLTIPARWDKKNLCATRNKGQMLLYYSERWDDKYVTKKIVVWGNVALTDEYGKEKRIQLPGPDMTTYCATDALVPAVDEKTLLEYDLLKVAQKQKVELCKKWQASQGANADK